MKTKFLIIGGGIAGLSAANYLAESGNEVTLLEEGSYPAHKICGEFISPEVLPLLKQWQITPSSEVSSIQFITMGGNWTMALTDPAATLDRYTLDAALANRAIRFGATIRTATTVAKIEPPKKASEPYLVRLASGEEILIESLIISTGRLLTKLVNATPPTFSYIGIKAHFADMPCDKSLTMFLLPGAYFGQVDMGGNQANIAGLIRTSHKEALNPKAAFSSFLERPDSALFKKNLSTGRMLFDDFMTCPVPEFGIRTPPKWPNCYFLGDAMGVIPPATGNGISIGLTSGILAAKCALKKQPEVYREEWKKDYGSRISAGKLLHKIFLSKWLSKALPTICPLFPSIPHLFFQKTRGSSLRMS